MKRGASWPAAVVVILGLTIAANIWLIRVASADPSFAVEERYYQRALAWDDELAQRAANEQLGWRVRAAVSPIVRGIGATLRVTLVDAGSDAVQDAAVVARVVAVARAGTPVELVLHPDSSGGYRGHVALQRPGLWEVRLDIRRGPARFTAIERLDTRLAHP